MLWLIAVNTNANNLGKNHAVSFFMNGNGTAEAM